MGVGVVHYFYIRYDRSWALLCDAWRRLYKRHREPEASLVTCLACVNHPAVGRTRYYLYKIREEAEQFP